MHYTRNPPLCVLRKKIAVWYVVDWTPSKRCMILVQNSNVQVASIYKLHLSFLVYCKGKLETFDFRNGVEI